MIPFPEKSSPMRLVIDGHRLTPQRTGVGRCLESLLKNWAETGWPLDETVLILNDRAGLKRVTTDVKGLRTLVVGEGWPGLVWETFGLGRLLRAGDVLFAPANLVPLRWGGPTVLVVYDTLPWSVPDSFPWHVRLRFGWRYRISARRAGRVIVPSRATAADVARVHGVPEGRIRVVYPGPEPDFAPLPAGSPEIGEARKFVGIGDAPFFLFLGKRSRRRNVPTLLAGFEQHRRAFPRHRLVFAGPVGPEGLPGIDSGVIVAGHVDEPTLRGLLAAAIALVYPSDYEGFGLPVVEAMACGCPVITSRNSALVESGGDAAYYLADVSPATIHRALDHFATDGIAREKHITDGMAQAARFDPRNFADGIKNEIQTLANASGPRYSR